MRATLRCEKDNAHGPAVMTSHVHLRYRRKLSFPSRLRVFIIYDHINEREYSIRWSSTVNSSLQISAVDGQNGTEVRCMAGNADDIEMSERVYLNIAGWSTAAHAIYRLEEIIPGEKNKIFSVGFQGVCWY